MSSRKQLIADYSVAEKFFARVRSPLVGRPLTYWCRMFKEPEGYRLKTPVESSIPVHWALIRPDNTITFEAPAERMAQWSHTIATTLRDIVPFIYFREDKGIYRIVARNKASFYGKKPREVGYRYFQGITFNMLTGECLNPMPEPDKAKEIPDVRLQWRRDLTRMKRVLKTMAKLGGFDDMPVEYMHGYKVITKDRALFIAECLRLGQTNSELLKYVAMASWNYGVWMPALRPDYKRLLNREAVYKGIDYLFSANSSILREAYGVFETPPDRGVRL